MSWLCNGLAGMGMVSYMPMYDVYVCVYSVSQPSKSGKKTWKRQVDSNQIHVYSYNLSGVYHAVLWWTMYNRFVEGFSHKLCKLNYGKCTQNKDKKCNR